MMMRDDWGEPIPQPWPDPPRIQRGVLPDGKLLNYGAWFFSPRALPEPLVRVDISEEQWWEIYDTRTEEEHGVDGTGGWSCFYTKQWNPRTCRVELRPGHRYTEWPHATVCDPANLELASIAYGGKPVYWLKWNASTKPADYPALVSNGMFHPLGWKPQRKVHREKNRVSVGGPTRPVLVPVDLAGGK
jgi:hypothetical protein